MPIFVFYFIAMCTKNFVGQYHQSRSSGDISWICRGRFGIIKLNCKIGTNKTAQTMHSCCEATVNHHGKEETYQKGSSVEMCSFLCLAVITCNLTYLLKYHWKNSIDRSHNIICLFMYSFTCLFIYFSLVFVW